MKSYIILYVILTNFLILPPTPFPYGHGIVSPLLIYTPKTPQKRQTIFIFFQLFYKPLINNKCIFTSFFSLSSKIGYLIEDRRRKAFLLLYAETPTVLRIRKEQREEQYSKCRGNTGISSHYSVKNRILSLSLL